MFIHSLRNVGEARLYPYLPAEHKKTIPALTFGDGQFNTIARDFYTDKSFYRDANGDINLRKLYGLLTGSNKMSYIDTFLGRSVNAYEFTESLIKALEYNTALSWFLS